MKTPEGIKYVYKGELLTADEFIKAQDEIIQELREDNEKLKGEIQNLLNEYVYNLTDKQNGKTKGEGNDHNKAMR